MSPLLSAGTPAPDFTLPKSPDAKLRLADTRGHPVILAFYPADWSPVRRRAGRLQ
jgi:peroxiredoxin